MKCGGKLGCINDGILAVNFRSVRTQSNGLLGYLCQECADYYAAFFGGRSEANKKVHKFVPRTDAPPICTCGLHCDSWEHGGELKEAPGMW